MRKYICLFVLCIASITIAAQETREMKIVQLKSGITVTGYVTNNDDGSIILTTTDGDQLFYQAAEVKSIDYLEKPDKKKREGITMREKGLQLSVEYDYGKGDDGRGSVSVSSLKIIPSYRFNKNFTAGVAVGVTSYVGGERYWVVYLDDYYYDDYIYRYDYKGLSLEAVLQYDFVNNTRFMPFLGLNVGGSLKNDLIVGCEAGLMLRITNGGGPYLGGFFEYIRDIQTIGIKAGWTF